MDKAPPTSRSSFAPTLNTYRDTELSTIAAGTESDVRYILEGAVQHAGNKVRVTAQLIDVQDQQTVWVETCSKSVATRASCPVAHGLLGLVLIYSGDPESAVSSAKEALKLERVYPPWLINVLATA